MKEERRPCHDARCGEPPWTSPLEKPPDFRFVNIAAVELDEIAREISAGRLTMRNATFAFDQYISMLDYSALAPEQLLLVPELRRRVDLELAMKLFRTAKLVQSSGNEPRDLFFLS